MALAFGTGLSLALFMPSVMSAFILQSYYIDATATLARSFGLGKASGRELTLALSTQTNTTLEDTVNSRMLMEAMRKKRFVTESMRMMSDKRKGASGDSSSSTKGFSLFCTK